MKEGIQTIGEAVATNRSAGDQIRTCVECEQTYVFSAGEQRFYAERDLSPPRRCKPCRQQKRAANERQEARAATQPGTRVQTEIVCAQCGQKATVPFVPVQGRAVYCYACHLQQRG